MCDVCVVCQGPAWEALWQQCCSDCALVRSACCDAVVLLVDQGHTDLHYVLNSVLNLLPSARYRAQNTLTPALSDGIVHRSEYKSQHAINQNHPLRQRKLASCCDVLGTYRLEMLHHSHMRRVFIGVVVI